MDADMMPRSNVARGTTRFRASPIRASRSDVARGTTRFRAAPFPTSVLGSASVAAVASTSVAPRSDNARVASGSGIENMHSFFESETAVRALKLVNSEENVGTLCFCPITFQWKVDLINCTKECVSSPQFVMPHVLGRAYLYTNYRNCVWIEHELERQAQANEINISLSLSVKVCEKVLFTKTFDNIYKEKLAGKVLCIVKRSTLLKIIDSSSSNDKSLVVTWSISYRGSNTVKERFFLKKSTENLLQNFKDIFLSKEFSDVTITVGDRDFFAHKNILSARSDVFLAMFKHGTKESSSGIIVIEDCDPDSFEDFLKFLYTSETGHVSSGNMTSIYKIADKYNLPDLTEVCCDTMMKNMTIDSIFDILELADLYNEDALLGKATDFFLQNFLVIMECEKWIVFLKEKTVLANNLLKNLTRKRKLPTWT